MLDFGIAGKKAVVCASSKGLGFGCADALAATGVNLVMCARTAATLASAAQSIRDRHGVSVDEVACDITTEEGRAAVLDAAGHVDILVNNVGQSERIVPESADNTVWQQQMDLNFNSVMMACRAALPQMIEQGGGVIVNISSIAGIRYLGKPQIAYSAAKAALQQYTKTSAVIHAPNNIRMNCVLPGLMHTAMVERMAEKYADGDYQGFVQKRHNQVPMGRMGSAEDVAHAALFLASDEARYITGTELVVDGGVTATIPE